MSARKRLRWFCPRDLHPGVLAPRRLATDDVRRFCLPCSKTVGKLVRRLAPVLEKDREERKARARASRAGRLAQLRAERALFRQFQRQVAGVGVLEWLKKHELPVPRRFFTRKTLGPGAMLGRKGLLVLRVGDWADACDVHAQLLVWCAMQYPAWPLWSPTRRRETIRMICEDKAGVRPLLDHLARAPVEVAMLLRKKGVARELGT